MTTEVHRPPADPTIVRAGTPGVTPPAPCILCSSSSSRRFEVSGIWIRQCNCCGHQFAEITNFPHHVQEIYGDDYFSQGGAGYSDYLSESKLLIDRAGWYATRLARHARPGTMLEVGAAAGFTLRGFADAGWDVLGLEPNAKMAEYARTQLHVAIEPTTLEAFRSGHQFDLVTMLQVLPHFANPRAAIQQAAQILRPGGHLLIETWNRQSWTARLFGKGWHEYSPPSVLHWFSKQALIRLLESEGFTLIEHGRPPRWISMGHAKSVLRSKADRSLAYQMLLATASILPDGVAVPYPCDDLIWMLLRQGDIKREVP